MSVPGTQVAFAAPLPDGLCACPPAVLAARLVSHPGDFWLDSSDAGGDAEAWSYIGWKAGHVTDWKITSAGGAENPFDLLRRELGIIPVRNESPVGDGAPAFCGGWFAQLSYDLGRSIERLPDRNIDDLPFPLIYLSWHPLVLGFSHRQKRYWVAGLVDSRQNAEDRSAWLIRQVEGALACQDAASKERNVVLQESDQSLQPVCSNLSRGAYESAVGRALEYIAAGDIYQVNLSQRFEATWNASAFDLYQRLRQVSSARYGVFACLGEGRHICSISPELYLKRRGQEVLTKPIKGTRRRGSTGEEDARLREELARCAKERAELNMIVDLERNDLGRVCEYGSIRVISDGEVEEHPTVFHRVASVSGQLRAGVGASELLRATFPGGSITGAPKIRAMSIIEELEPSRRGPYCGSLGWLGVDGNLELNIAIRTALVDERAGKVWYQAGGGIVADSDPAREYEESLEKAAAFFRAVRGAYRYL